MLSGKFIFCTERVQDLGIFEVKDFRFTIKKVEIICLHVQ